jgi:hypothetical protein
VKEGKAVNGATREIEEANPSLSGKMNLRMAQASQFATGSETFPGESWRLGSCRGHENDSRADFFVALVVD